MGPTLDYWKRLVRGSVRGLTDEQVDAAAALCDDTAETFGVSYGTWHAAAVVTGNLARCACSPCSKAREGVA